MQHDFLVKSVSHGFLTTDILREMGKPQAKKRGRGRESTSDTSLSSPAKRSCSRRRTEQRSITDYATRDTTRDTETEATSEDKLDRVLAAISDLRGIPRSVEELKQTIDLLRGEVLDLTHKCQGLEKELNRQKTITEKQNQLILEARDQAQLAWSKLDDLEQWNRRSNIRIINLPDPDEKESNENCLQRVMNFLKRAIDIEFLYEHEVDICHRVGRYEPGNPRAVIVKFVRRTTKMAVMRGRLRNLPRGSPFVVEDLTKRRFQLLMKARNFPGARNAWSREGTIYARLWGDRIIQITEETNWEKLHDEAMLSPEPGTMAIGRHIRGHDSFFRPRERRPRDSSRHERHEQTQSQRARNISRWPATERRPYGRSDPSSNHPDAAYYGPNEHWKQNIQTPDKKKSQEPKSDPPASTSTPDTRDHKDSKQVPKNSTGTKTIRTGKSEEEELQAPISDKSRSPLERLERSELASLKIAPETQETDDFVKALPVPMDTDSSTPRGEPAQEGSDGCGPETADDHHTTQTPAQADHRCASSEVPQPQSVTRKAPT